MLDVVFWKWRRPEYRSRFTAHHVNIAANMVRRHYDRPHRINCITDDGEGIDKTVRVIPLWKDFAHMRNPSFRSGPSCYCRLKAYSADFADIVGPRFVSVDLDFCAVGDLSPVWDRDDDYVVWGDTFLKNEGRPGLNGSMWMMDAGARRQVWDRFDPLLSPSRAHEAGCKGSDQGWVTYVLGRDREKMWTTEDGVYSWRKHIATNGRALPEGARIVFFHGIAWDQPAWAGSALRGVPWIVENYK